jgi:TonB family protein
MTTPARAPLPPGPNQRRVPRCPLAVPVQVTVRRTTGSQGIPGRSLDLGEGGIAAVLAGELQPGDPVGVEFLLPELGLGLHTLAVVRYHAALRSGLEFQTLSLEQQAMIRRWTRRVLENQAQTRTRTESAFPSGSTVSEAIRPTSPGPKLHARKRSWLRPLLVPGMLALVAASAFSWWRWKQAWTQLDQQAAAYHATKAQRIELPPGVMDQFLVYRGDAPAPDDAGGTEGTALLKVVIGADGTVIDQRPVSGPGELTRAAMESVKNWRFQPYKIGGKSVEVETTLAVEVPR